MVGGRMPVKAEEGAKGRSERGDYCWSLLVSAGLLVRRQPVRLN